jgi:hypothetical protein
MMDLGDRLGAALKYNFSPSFYIQLSVEGRKQSYALPPYQND